MCKQASERRRTGEGTHTHTHTLRLTAEIPLTANRTELNQPTFKIPPSLLFILFIMCLVCGCCDIRVWLRQVSVGSLLSFLA